MIHAAVTSLVGLIPPPDSGDRFDWDDLAERTGWHYPGDYRHFLEIYGAGGLICAAQHHTTVFGHHSHFQSGCPSAHQLYVISPPPFEVEYRVDRGALRWPAEGRRPWGGGADCLVFRWQCTDPDPDKWTVVISKQEEDDPGETDVLAVDMGMADTLLAVVTGRLDLAPHLTMPGTPIFEGWRAHELRFREEYPTFREWDGAVAR